MISSLEFGIGLDFCTPFKASPIRFLTWQSFKGHRVKKVEQNCMNFDE